MGKRKQWLVVCLTGLLALSGIVGAAALTGEEILSKVDGVLDSKTTIMDAVMTTVDSK